MAFTPQQPDFALSPHTGMTRRHWLDACRFLLDGALRHVAAPDAPILIPGDVRPPDRPFNLETFARTFMIAAPLVAADAACVIRGLNVRDYYASQLLAALTPGSPLYVGSFADESRRRAGRAVSGHTVEGAALAVGLWLAGDAIWPRYSRHERDTIAAWFHEVAHARTNSHNWRFFNVLMAAFLRSKGCGIDAAMLRGHLESLLAYDAGDGWYRDGTHFDFYSAWAFQFYAPIYLALGGKHHEPDLARQFEKNHLALQRTCPMLFSRQGHAPMWGRSILYRCAAAAPLAAAFLLDEPALDPGHARRIASGCLLQFLSRDDVFDQGVPTLGFYRAFPPIVQSYSRRESAYWLAKIFVALALPEFHPFWTATESEAHWPALAGTREARTVSLPGPGLTLTQHGPTGAAELRPGKVRTSRPDLLYTRLVYNTEFPSEADNPAGATAGAYAVQPLDASPPPAFAPAINLRYAGMRDGVLYRQADLAAWWARVDLADIIVPGGVVRVDRLSVNFPHELRLGHFALPHTGGPARIDRRLVEGRQVILGTIADGRSVALVTLAGWDTLAAETHAALSPEADESTLLLAARRDQTTFARPTLCASLLLHRTSGEWSDAQLDLVASLKIFPIAPSGAPLGAHVTLRDGSAFLVDFGPLAGTTCD